MDSWPVLYADLPLYTVDRVYGSRREACHQWAVCRKRALRPSLVLFESRDAAGRVARAVGIYRRRNDAYPTTWNAFLDLLSEYCDYAPGQEGEDDCLVGETDLAVARAWTFRQNIPIMVVHGDLRGGDPRHVKLETSHITPLEVDVEEAREFLESQLNAK